MWLANLYFLPLQKIRPVQILRRTCRGGNAVTGLLQRRDRCVQVAIVELMVARNEEHRDVGKRAAAPLERVGASADVSGHYDHVVLPRVRRGKPIRRGVVL